MGVTCKLEIGEQLARRMRETNIFLNGYAKWERRGVDKQGRCFGGRRF